MKYDYERIALWSIVVLLVIAVFFQQRRSGFSIQPGAETSNVSVLDMMEYSYIPEVKRRAYRGMLMSNATALTSITDGGMYRMKVDQIMMTALNMPVPPEPMGMTSNTIPMPGPKSCTGLIIMGDCVNSNVCPTGMMKREIGTLKYCVCSNLGYKIIPSPNGPTCIRSCPTTMPKVITEDATKQQMCMTSCPTTMPPGYSCV